MNMDKAGKQYSRYVQGSQALDTYKTVKQYIKVQLDYLADHECKTLLSNVYSILEKDIKYKFNFASLSGSEYNPNDLKQGQNHCASLSTRRSSSRCVYKGGQT